MSDTNDPAGADHSEVQVQPDTGQSRRGFLDRSRGLVAVVGVLLSCLLLAAAVLGVWARRSFLKTDGFVERAGSLVDEPEVQAALAGWLSGEINELIDAETVIAEALPDQASLLAVPLSGAVEGFVEDAVVSFVASEPFAVLWKGSVEIAHGTASALLTGDAELIEAQQDGVVINLLPVINDVLAEITSASPEIFGRTVDLPEVTVEDVPEDARRSIGEAIGVELDEDFGTFVIYDEGSLETVQKAVELVDQLVWLLVVAAPLMIAGTLLLSDRRRRTTLQLTVGIALTMVLIRRLVLLFQDDLLDLVKNQQNLGAVDATASAFLDPLLDGAQWLGIAALVIAVVAAVSGPYAWAVSLRGRAVAYSRAVVGAVSDRSEDEDTLVWVAANRDALQIGGAVVGVLVLWWVDVSWFGFFVLAALVGLFELGVTRLGDRGEALEDDREPDVAR